MLELATPECRVGCVPLTAAERARLYSAFVGHSFQRMGSHPIEASPHRGGVCLAARWDGAMHKVCDVATTELDRSWRRGFEALVREVVDTLQAARLRLPPGDPAAVPAPPAPAPVVP